MIKRPLDQRFRDAVLEGRKITTMRVKPWPVGKPIVLYHWTGAAYRSKHVDIAVIEVLQTDRVVIRRDLDGHLSYRRGGIFELPRPLWFYEGFAAQADMDEWFGPLLKKDPLITRHLMLFRVIKPLAPL
jgi:hypothetical protein